MPLGHFNREESFLLPLRSMGPVAWDALAIFTALLVLVTAALAWCTWRLVVATNALKDVQDTEFKRLQPRILIRTSKGGLGGDLLRTGPIELDLMNEGQQETTLSNLQITVRDSPNSARGYPILEPMDLTTGQALPFPIRIPGAAHLRIRARVAGGSVEIIKGSRLEWEAELTRGEVSNPSI